MRGGNEKRLYSLDSDNGRLACTAVEEKVKQSPDSDNVWYSSDSKQKRFAVDWIQVVSEKLQITLASRPLRFCPLHITILKIIEEKGRMLILAGRATRVFPVASYQKKKDENIETFKSS